MISLEVPDEELLSRLLERGKSSGRPDDANSEVIGNRLRVYHKETAIVQRYYEKQRKHIVVNGLGSVEQISSVLKAEIGHF